MNRLWAKEIMPPCAHTISVFGKEYALNCRKEDSGVTRKVDNEVPSTKANQ